MAVAAAKDELLEYLRKQLREQLNDITDNIATGSCEDYPAYKYQTGIIDGLVRAERALLDIDEMQYRGDDD